MRRTFGAVLAISISAFLAGCLGEAPIDDEPATTSESSALSGDRLLSMVAVNINTGGDDKRGDSRVWLRVRLWNGNSVIQEIGYGQTYADWGWSGWQYMALPSSTRVWDVQSLDVLWQQGGGGWNGDNWNMQSISIYALDGQTGQWSFQGAPWGNPLYRFTGNATFYAWGWYY